LTEKQNTSDATGNCWPISFDHVERVEFNGQLTSINGQPLPELPRSTLAASSDSGRPLDNFTSDNTPTFVVQTHLGSLEESGFVLDPADGAGGLIVEIQATHATSGQTTAVRASRLGETSLWSAEFVTQLPDGQYFVNASVSVRAASGEVVDQGPLSPPTLMIIDTTAPADAGAPEAEGGILTSAEPTFRGEGEAGSTIRVLANGEVVGQTIANDHGWWELKVQQPMSDGQYDVSVEVEDLAGNVNHAGAGNLRILVDADQIVDLMDGQFHSPDQRSQSVSRAIASKS
jgi:hypothetical protein